jgi:oxygen-independent coproporphyrinogen-3 oxidase
MQSELSKIRRNIHTYPFKYNYHEPEDFFELEAGSIYIHIPFCSTKCHFCEYTVYTGKSAEVQERYVKALCREIDRFTENPAFPGFRIEAIYLGGGTPGTLSADQLIRILQACRNNFTIDENCEVCCEFDPSCVDAGKASLLRQAGYTRFSMGVQSFNSEILRQSNRPHDRESIFRAFRDLRAAGCDHVNLDLIYPMPGLTQQVWLDSVEQALALEPECLTIYGLEIWPGTAYYNWLQKGNLSLPAGDEEVRMYTSAAEALDNAGFVPRSNSGYYHPERTARYCRFLDFYWRTWPMIGFGVSSKSVVHNRLWTNIKPLYDYMDRAEAGASVMDFGTRITKAQEMRRVMIRGLKMCEVSKADFRNRFGVGMETVFSREIRYLIDKELLVDEPERVVLTPRGRAYGTNVYETFYTEEDLRPPSPGEVQFGISTLVAQ